MACAASVGAGCLICIARGSRILTPVGLRTIESLAVGDTVYCIDPRTHELVWSRVVVHRSGVRECMALHAGGHCLVLTSTHPVYDAASGEFRQAGALALDPHARVLVVDDDGVRSLHLERVEPYVGLLEVHDLSVEHPLHDFVAEGIVVHNKSDDSSSDFDNTAPTAVITAPSPIAVGTEVSVDGHGSMDRDGDPLTFRFAIELAPDGSEATLYNGELVHETIVSFTRFTPDVEGQYRIALEVFDGSVRSDPDTITVTAQTSADETTGDATSSNGSDGTTSSGSEATSIASSSSSGDATTSSTSDGASESGASSASSGGTTG